MEKKQKINKILFIIFVTLFTLLWITSLVFTSFAVFSEDITKDIVEWYGSWHEEAAEDLNLLSVSGWSLAISTVLLVITLLMSELKKKYK